MAITRIGLIALADAAKQDEAVARFSNFATDCKKDGQTYIVSSKASKCKVLTDVPGSQPWSVAYEITFASEEDMEYYQTKDPIYQELMKQAAEGKATGFIAVAAEF
ncbi:stress responsive A/B barrel domain-containing protein [Colletotrichum musicola]|uniref:Stress responsive A/B barrel domain-containing protein n=2 Tax=Colletotrichum orchidearum species complex TaxID=2707337 RepID=A0A8H6NVC9_9PEZI|nr:stress responsive A/B barrel domain-containing protein [Colletotrichum plurivorum]KAF6843202.1 stress responsive A/B barrel domain-containing protein [Colletotrichum musicola]